MEQVNVILTFNEHLIIIINEMEIITSYWHLTDIVINQIKVDCKKEVDYMHMLIINYYSMDMRDNVKILEQLAIMVIQAIQYLIINLLHYILLTSFRYY